MPLILTVFVNRRAGALSAVFQTVFALFIYYKAIGTNMLPVILMTYLFLVRWQSWLSKNVYPIK